MTPLMFHKMMDCMIDDNFIFLLTKFSRKNVLDNKYILGHLPEIRDKILNLMKN